MARNQCIFLTGYILLWCAGCETPAPPPIRFDTVGVDASADVSDLAAVLAEAVDEQGYLIMDDYLPLEDRLVAQLRRFAVSGPQSSPELYPDTDAKLAYWLNVRTAWAMYLAAQWAREDAMSGDGMGEQVFVADGREMTLRGIDQRLEKLGGYHAVIAAPCMNLQRVRVPSMPLLPDYVQEHIRTWFAVFVDDEQRFIIDVADKAVRFPPVIWRYREEIRAEYTRRYGVHDVTLTTCLLPYVDGSAMRRLQNAIGYRCVEHTAPSRLAVVRQRWESSETE